MHLILGTTKLEQPLSPCIRQCCLDDDDVCLGCFRTLPEIVGWSQADAKTRQNVLDNCQTRKQAYFLDREDFW